MSTVSKLGSLCVALFSAAVTGQAAGKVRTIDGRELQGAVVVAANGDVTVSGETSNTVIRIDELVSFVSEGVEVRNVRTEHRVWLRSGVDLPVKRLSGRAAADGMRRGAPIPAGRLEHWG